MRRYLTPLSMSRAGVVVIGALSFWLSFIALTALARDSGFGEAEAYAWPVIVDGVVIVSTVALFASRDRFALFLLICGATASLAGNGIHAWTLTQSWIAVAVFEVPPLALLSVSHLSMRLAKHVDNTTAIVEPRHSPAQAPRSTETNEQAESVPAPTEEPDEPFTPASGILSPLEKIARAYELLDEGVSGREVARNLDVSEASVRRWKKAREDAEAEQVEPAA